MVKLSIIFMFFCLANAIATPTARIVDKRPESVQAWFKNLPNAKEKFTKLHFYFHDTVAGKNPTAVTVAGANVAHRYLTGFGLIRMMDNPLTVGPEPHSKIIGRARGIYGVASIEDLDLLMTLNYVFTEGKYSGSTLSVLAHNPILDKYREMPIIGGTGVFRLARGIATAQTTWFNMTSQDAVVEYNVMVLYYEN
ncbi:dirigent protein 21-like [Salvia miltiorrhiza]|uniref:dirigent protein 21-like n=1 Tax=Salvia miltiorrhiza TaxID=226208 RepID=UPI0025AC4BFF|nr:dirigent protein 21-like [Salvia miltiorrhiza]